MKKRVLVAFASLICVYWHGILRAQDVPSNACQRPAAVSILPEPEDLRSRNGVLKVDLTIQNSTEADGSVRYCYTDAQGNQSPNLRLKTGDLLVLRLKNDLTASAAAPAAAMHLHGHMQMNDADTKADKSLDDCA